MVVHWPGETGTSRVEARAATGLRPSMVMAKPTPLLVLALAKTTPATWPSGSACRPTLGGIFANTAENRIRTGVRAVEQ